MPTARVKIAPKTLLIVAVAETLVIGGAAFRLTQSPPSDALKAWFISTVVLAASSIPVLIVMTQRPVPTEQNLSDDGQKRALSISLSILVLAGLLCAAGPRIFEQILG